MVLTEGVGVLKPYIPGYTLYFLYIIKPFYCYSYLLKISIMVLTRSQYENMSKEELIQELTDINSSFVNEAPGDLRVEYVHTQ